MARFFRRRPRFSVSVQIQELVLGGCRNEKLPEFEQLVLKVTGRRALSSRNKKLAFRLPAAGRDFQTEQTLPFCERFPFQGKLQRRWRRQKPQIIRFRLFGLPRRSKRSVKKKILLAEFQADLAPHLDHLFSLDAPESTFSSATLVTTPSGPFHALQPSLASTPDRPRSFPLHLEAREGCNMLNSRLSILLDSIHIVKRESRVRRSDQDEVAATKRLLYRGRPQRLVELVRTVPLMYRHQPDGNYSSSIANSVLMNEYTIPRLDVNTDSDSGSNSSSDSSSGDDRKDKPVLCRRVKKTSGATGERAPVVPAEVKQHANSAFPSAKTAIVSRPSRRSSLSLSQMGEKQEAKRNPEKINHLTVDDEQECKLPVNLTKDSPRDATEFPNLPQPSNGTGSGVGKSVVLTATRTRARFSNQLPTIPDDDENEEDTGPEEVEHDADDEDDRQSYNFVQSELDHRDAIIAALRAENRAQAALIAQLQTENRRLRVEAACREPGNVLIASMSTSSLAQASTESQMAIAKAEIDSATDSELIVAKRSASVPFLSPQLPPRTNGARSSSPAIAQPRRRASARSASATDAGMPEETVFEGLVQEIQEEFRCLLPAQARAISSA